jgi:hypothetical protein
MRKFQKYGINVLRIFSQWDQKNPWVDVCPDCTLFQRDGTLREKSMARLKEILADADALGMVVELEVFQHQSWREGNLGATDEARAKAAERALPLLTRELLPYRNLTFQLYGEMTFKTPEYTKLVKASDPKRLVTNSPGGSGVLGTRQENEALDYLTPHTTRQTGGRHWEIAPREFDYLLSRYRNLGDGDRIARAEFGVVDGDLEVVDAGQPDPGPVEGDGGEHHRRGEHALCQQPVGDAQHSFEDEVLDLLHDLGVGEDVAELAREQIDFRRVELEVRQRGNGRDLVPSKSRRHAKC